VIVTEKLKAECLRTGTKYVGYRGDPHARVWVIGEAPGADEDAAGIPFVGASGKELDRMLLEASFDLNEVCLTNPYKVRPPDNDLLRISELPIPDIKDLCERQFTEELNEYKPTILIPCGATATGILCPDTISKRTGTASIAKWRGSILSSPGLKWPHYCIPAYHPAFILREWPERQVTILCLEKAREEYDYCRQHAALRPLPERQLIVCAGADDVVDFLRAANEPSVEAISVDIETVGRGMPCTIAIAVSPSVALAFELYKYEKTQLARIWRHLDILLRSKPQIGQNYFEFDCCWLEAIGLRPNISKASDTMVRHHVLWPELEHKLQFQTMQYTREPYYKDEGRSWHPKEGIARLLRYNAKDAATTYEVFLAEGEELNDRSLTEFEEYEQELTRKYHWISKRGLLTDKSAIMELGVHIDRELGRCCGEISTLTGAPTSTDKESASRLAASLKRPAGEIINLNSPKQVLALLKGAGLKIPKKRGTGTEGTGAEILNEIHAKTGHQLPKLILDTRELSKMKGTYVNVPLDDGVLYSSYVTTGTVTGRRSSRANVFGLGTNHQNLPKHSVLGKKFLGCLIARPGHVFVSCDQEQAEDWIVQAIIADVSGKTEGLNELRSHVDRHRKLASFLFSKPEAECGKDTAYRFFGKKTRHAANYDMHAPTMSEAFLKEGFSVPVSQCEYFLTKFHEFDPTIRSVYHEFVKHELNNKHLLRTPLGRERIFFGLRPYANNEKTYKEGYAYIPQSTVGDNTGLAVLYCEQHGVYVVLETHDAVTLEVEDSVEAILSATATLREAFHRTLVFPNGLEIEIPIEMEIGYSLQKTVKLCQDNLNAIGLRSILSTLRSSQRAPSTITYGAQQPSSVPV